MKRRCSLCDGYKEVPLVVSCPKCKGQGAYSERVTLPRKRIGFLTFGYGRTCWRPVLCKGCRGEQLIRVWLSCWRCHGTGEEIA